MSEALDLSFNSPSSEGSSPAVVNSQLPQQQILDRADDDDDDFAQNLLSIKCGTDFLQKSFKPIPSPPDANSLLAPLFLSIPFNLNGRVPPTRVEGDVVDLSTRMSSTSPASLSSALTQGLSFFKSSTTSINEASHGSLSPFNLETFLLPVATTTLASPHRTPGILHSKGPNGTSSTEPLTKFLSFQECGNSHCRLVGHREHYHCAHCDKAISRREDTLRHLKWHKKREESLQYGFMRYSPNDDCGVDSCIHNSKQTHYHCLRPNCFKIYVSTSDVQLHANYHRKDSVILQEGFQRFRAAENCGSSTCPFSTERTTHFHCRRHGCSFTFKNKADLEKHKNHHQKNDVIAKDGFRKFTKYEHCKFQGCKYSGIINHIHCIRPGCDYIVHSASQISSHKRKHERRQVLHFQPPLAPQSDYIFSPLKENSSVTAEVTGSNTTTTPGPSPQPHDVSLVLDSPIQPPSTKAILQQASRIVEISWQMFQDPMFKPTTINDSDLHTARDVIATVRSSLRLFNDKESCGNEQCSLNCTRINHFHCFRAGCMDSVNVDADEPRAVNTSAQRYSTLSSGYPQAWKSHWCGHAWQSTLALIGYTHCTDDCSCVTKAHLHCKAGENCAFTVETALASATALTQHLTRHDYNFATFKAMDESSHLQQECGLIPRKRGRPPKHSPDIHVPRLEVSSSRQCQDENPHLELTSEDFLPENNPDCIAGSAKLFLSTGPPCVDRCCPFHAGGGQDHFHCIRPRCHMATTSLFILNTHRREFHAMVDIEPGYDYFDRSIDCRRPACNSRRDTSHFHCLRPRCGYAFVRVGKMPQHTAFHESAIAGELSHPVLVPSRTPPTPLLPPLGLGKDGFLLPDLIPFILTFLGEQMKIDQKRSIETPIHGVVDLKLEGNQMDWTESAEMPLEHEKDRNEDIDGKPTPLDP